MFLFGLILLAGLMGCGASPADHPLLEMTFAHVDHREESCLSCHHDYADDTGPGLCIDCHKRSPELALLIEEQFHGLCRGCHASRRAEGEPAGPVRACNLCHEADLLP